MHNGALRGECAPSSSRHTFYFRLRNVEGGGTLWVVEKPVPQAPEGETFAQALAALKDHYRVSESEVARRIGSHVSTVNNWAHGKAAPRPAALRRLAAEFPAFSEARLLATVGKRAPAPLSPDRRSKVLEVFDRLTEEQQEMLLIQASAVAERNEQ